MNRYSHMLNNSREVLLWMLFALGVMLILAALFYIYRTIKVYRRSLFVVSLLNGGDPERFLEEIEKDVTAAMEADDARMTNMLIVNKSAGLIHLGRYDEARSFLESVDTDKLAGAFGLLRVNNMLYCLLMAGRFDEATRFRQENAAALDAGTRNRQIGSAVRETLAIHEFHRGDIENSEAELEKTVAAPGAAPVIQKAGAYYYLGLISLRRGNANEARDRFENAIANAGKSHIGKLAGLELEKLGPADRQIS